MGKVIKFPGTLTEPVQQSVDNFYENELYKKYIEDFVDKVGHGLVNEFHRNGYDVDDEDFIVRFMYSLEVMKSVLYNSKDIDHILTKHVGEQAKLYFENEVKSNE